MDLYEPGSIQNAEQNNAAKIVGTKSVVEYVRHYAIWMWELNIFPQPSLEGGPWSRLGQLETP